MSSLILFGWISTLTGLLHFYSVRSRIYPIDTIFLAHIIVFLGLLLFIFFFHVLDCYRAFSWHLLIFLFWKLSLFPFLFISIDYRNNCFWYKVSLWFSWTVDFNYLYDLYIRRNLHAANISKKMQAVYQNNIITLTDFMLTNVEELLTTPVDN